MSNLKETIYNMMIENTGTHMCDSGGDEGRGWQRNGKLTIKDFESKPEATMELSIYGDDKLEANATIDLFHYLNQNLELDSLCNQFNSQPTSNWDSEEFYGVSDSGEEMLSCYFELKGDNWNSCNWDCPLSQGVQGRTLEHIETGDEYVLLQIHNGADVRGGYTDAKLFKVTEYCEFFLSCDCYFETVDYCGEWLNREGSCATEEDWNKLKDEHKVTKDNSVIVNGSIAC